MRHPEGATGGRGRRRAWLALAMALAAQAAASAQAPGAGSPTTRPGAAVHSPAGAGRAGGAQDAEADLLWIQSAADLEAFARAALPVRLDIAGAWTGQELVVDGASGLRAESGRLRFHLTGRVDPLGVPIEADPVLTLRFDPVKGAYVVAMEALSLALGPLGRVDLSRLLGPWEIRPDQKIALPVRGSAGVGMDLTLRRLTLSPQGLRVEAAVRYFPPPPADRAR